MIRFDLIGSLSRRRPFALAAPGTDPVLDLFVRGALAAVERGNSLLDAGDLPFVYVEVRVERLGGEKRPRPPGALGQLLQALLDLRLDADGEGCRGHGFIPLYSIVYMLARQRLSARRQYRQA